MLSIKMLLRLIQVVILLFVIFYLNFFTKMPVDAQKTEVGNQRSKGVEIQHSSVVPGNQRLKGVEIEHSSVVPGNQRSKGVEIQHSNGNQRSKGVDIQHSSGNQRSKGVDIQHSSGNQRSKGVDIQRSSVVPGNQRSKGVEIQHSNGNQRSKGVDIQHSSGNQRSKGVDIQHSSGNQRSKGVEIQHSSGNQRSKGVEIQHSSGNQRSKGIEIQHSSGNQRSKGVEVQHGSGNQRSKGVEIQHSSDPRVTPKPPKTDEVHNITLGVIFDQHYTDVQEAFKFAIDRYYALKDITRLEFKVYVDVINTADVFKLSRLICHHFARGVISMIGAVEPDSFDTLHSYSNTFEIPFVTPWFPEKVLPTTSGYVDYAMSIRPDYHKAVIDTITYYGWKSIIYVYDSHDGLLRLQQIFQSLQPGRASFRITNVKRVSKASEVVAFLVSLEKISRWSNKYVILDSGPELAKEALILHVRDVYLGRRNYHYFLSGLVMDVPWEKEVVEFGAINITGFRVVDSSNKFVQNFMTRWPRKAISAQGALMYDTLLVLVDSVVRMLQKRPEFVRYRRTNSSSVIDCNPKNQIIPYEYGERISRIIKRTEIEGLTGPLRFTEAGHRRNFSLLVMEMTEKGEMIKIGKWYDYKGLIPISSKYLRLRDYDLYDRNKTYIVTTITEDPYLIRIKEFDDPKAYKGFCVDLAQLLMDKLEINYEIRLVKDNKYGAVNPKLIGGWDGMVGELVRQEADMAIAPLIVTIEREEVIDFSKPFLSFDTAKPQNPSDFASIFVFLRPLSLQFWLSILGCMFGVSVCLFLVSRCSPSEWRIMSLSDSHTTDTNEIATTRTTVVNEFGFWDSIWFSLGSFMQQGSDITPRSFSGRIVGASWCLFALVVICNYTANMASYLTITRINEPILTYSRLTTCPGDHVPRHEEKKNDDPMWMGFLSAEQFTGESDSKIPCKMMVSVAQSGVKDFAVAFPKGSRLREGVNLALQTLKDDGELQALVRKWFIDNKCSADSQVHGKELTLNQLAGIFYILLGGMSLALIIAVFEFCRHRRSDTARANLSIRMALRAKALRTSRPSTPVPESEPQEEQETMDWNGGAYGGYYASSNEPDQEETSLHDSFTHV